MAVRSMGGHHTLPTTPGRDRRYIERTLVVDAHSKVTAMERARARMTSQGLIVHPFQGKAEAFGNGLYRCVVKVARTTGGTV